MNTLEGTRFLSCDTKTTSREPSSYAKDQDQGKTPLILWRPSVLLPCARAEQRQLSNSLWRGMGSCPWKGSSFSDLRMMWKLNPSISGSQVTTAHRDSHEVRPGPCNKVLEQFPLTSALAKFKDYFMSQLNQYNIFDSHDFKGATSLLSKHTTYHVQTCYTSNCIHIVLTVLSQRLNRMTLSNMLSIAY